MNQRTAHLAVYDTLADWETGYLAVELRTGRFTGEPFDVVTVGETAEPITTMGGVRVLPDITLAELDPADSAILVLAGAEHWDLDPARVAFADAARHFLDAGVPVAAICGATAGLARAGLLDDRRHTSAAAEYLKATGYAGADRYVEQRAVADRGLVTAGPQSPVQFARAALATLGLAPDETLDAYERLFHGGDPSAFPVLQAAGG
jgi:putative intracellular protease/amidase